MEKKKLEIIGLSYTQSQSGAYALILGEIDGERRLPIIIGGLEAQAIAIAIEHIKPSRPLTHDLLKNFADCFEIILKEIIIYKFFEGVFYSNLICVHNLKEVIIDSRTSDAIALAIRFNCPIFTYEPILVSAGVILKPEIERNPQDSINIEVQNKQKEFENISLIELEEMLEEAIREEDFEIASRLRDEIFRRKGNY